MRDLLTVEARLSEALKRYADAAPIDVDALTYARAIATERRHRTLLRARPHGGLVVAIVLLTVALVAGVLAIGAHRAVTGPTQPSWPSVSPPVSPQPSGRTQTLVFDPPFDYALPSGTDLTPHYGNGLVLLMEDTQPWYGLDDAGVAIPDALGVTVATVRSANVHSCAPADGGRVSIRVAPADFLSDLTNIAGVAFGPIEPVAFDGGRAGFRATVDLAASRCENADFHVKGGNVGQRDYVVLYVPSQLLVADVDGVTVVIQIWAASSDALMDWLPSASQLVDSMHFNETP